MLPEAQSPESRIDLGPDSRSRDFYETMFQPLENLDELDLPLPVRKLLDTEEKRSAARNNQLNGFIRFRKEVLGKMSYCDERQLNELFGLSEQDITELIQANILLSFVDHETRLFPLFQFDPETEKPYEVVQAIDQLFDAQNDNWSMVYWWIEPHELLPNGCAPQDMLLDKSQHELLLKKAHDFAVSDWY